MPYQRSQANKDFDARVNDLRRAVVGHGKQKPIDSDVSALLRQAVMFQLCAAVEVYLEELFRNWMFLSVNAGLKSTNLPGAMRSYFLIAYQRAVFKNHLYDGDDEKAIKNLPWGHKVFHLSQDDRLLNELVVADRLLEGKDYPSSRNLKSLFKRVGISNIFDLVNAQAKSNVSLAYESFLDVRRAIAHSAPPALTSVDVKRHSQTVVRLVAALDRIVWRHVLKHTGAATW